MIAPVVVGIRVMVAQCAGCRRTFRYPLAVLETAESGPCNCGATYVRYVKEARHIGPRSKRWVEECGDYGIDPETGVAEPWLAGCAYFKWKDVAP